MGVGDGVVWSVVCAGQSPASHPRWLAAGWPRRRRNPAAVRRRPLAAPLTLVPAPAVEAEEEEGIY